MAVKEPSVVISSAKNHSYGGVVLEWLVGTRTQPPPREKWSENDQKRKLEKCGFCEKFPPSPLPFFEILGLGTGALARDHFCAKSYSYGGQE